MNSPSQNTLSVPRRAPKFFTIRAPERVRRERGEENRTIFWRRFSWRQVGPLGVLLWALEAMVKKCHPPHITY